MAFHGALRPPGERCRRFAAAWLVAIATAGCAREADQRAVVEGLTDPATRFSAAHARALIALPSSTDVPALNGTVFDELVKTEPRLAEYRRDLESRERAALAWLFAQADATAMPRVDPAPTAYANPAGESVWYRLGSSLLNGIVPPAQAQEVTIDSLRAGVVGMTFTSLAQIFGGSGPPGTELRRIEYPGERGPDGSLVVATDADGVPEVTVTTRADVPPLFVAANSSVALRATTLCPDPQGKVRFRIRLAQGGRAGSGNRLIFDRNREVTVDLTVGDLADIADARVEARYSDRSTDGGRQVYIESATAWSFDYSGEFRAVPAAHEVVRASSQATANDQALIDAGASDSKALAFGAILAAKNYWQDGNCIRIDATVPRSVARGAETRIPVTVRHRAEGNEIAARLDAELSGGASLEPVRIARTPGALTHRAPDERRARMSIRLTALSRRGKAEETLSLSIDGNQYNIEGGADEFTGTGLVCDLTAPFQVEGSGVVVRFTPTSDAGGTYTYSGQMSGFGVSGSGTYTVTYAGEVANGITATGPGSVRTPHGVVSNVGTERYTLTPTENAYCN